MARARRRAQRQRVREEAGEPADPHGREIPIPESPPLLRDAQGARPQLWPRRPDLPAERRTRARKGRTGLSPCRKTPQVERPVYFDPSRSDASTTRTEI